MCEVFLESPLLVFKPLLLLFYAYSFVFVALLQHNKSLGNLLYIVSNISFFREESLHRIFVFNYVIAVSFYLLKSLVKLIKYFAIFVQQFYVYPFAFKLSTLLFVELSHLIFKLLIMRFSFNLLLLLESMKLIIKRPYRPIESSIEFFQVLFVLSIIFCLSFFFSFNFKSGIIECTHA